MTRQEMISKIEKACPPRQLASDRFFGELGSEGGGNQQREEPGDFSPIVATHLQQSMVIPFTAE